MKSLGARLATAKEKSKNMKRIIVLALLTTGWAGCVSVESTREQLKSRDAAVVKQAEDNIVRAAVEGLAGPIQLGESEQMEYVKLAPDNKTLVRIIEGSYNSDIILLALSMVDIKKETSLDAFAGLCLKKNLYDSTYWEVFERFLPYFSEGILEELYNEDQGYYRRKAYLAQIARKSKDMDKLCKYVTSSDSDVWRPVVEGLIGRLNEIVDENLICGMLSWKSKDTRIGDVISSVDEERLRDKERLVEEKLGAWRETKEKQIEQMPPSQRAAARERLKAEVGARKEKIAKKCEDLKAATQVKVNDAVRMLASKLSDENKRKVALDSIERIWSLDFCKEGKKVDLALYLSNLAKDPSIKEQIFCEFLKKAIDSKKACESTPSASWTTNDESFTEETIEKMIGELPPKAIAKSVLEIPDGYRYVESHVTPDIAIEILKAKSVDSPRLETKLCEKVPGDRITLDLVSCVKSDAAQKALRDAMPQDVKKKLEKANAERFAVVLNKAKEAASKTFELDGFYLGMDWADMKIVLAHHFPDYVCKDIEDSDGEHELYVPTQRAPFALADKDGKVYRLAFGKKMLKKWYNYDVQDYMGWASAYGREMHMDFVYKMLRKEAEIFDFSFGEANTYHVLFYQETYQSKNNAKGYRLIFFGDEKDLTVQGGLAGAIIKEQAAGKFKYFRGDPGSLRVVYDKD